LSCLNLLSLSITLAAVSFSTLYFSVKRRSAISTLTHSFGDVDWGRYGGAGRLKRRQMLKREAENAYKMEGMNGNNVHETPRQSRTSTVIDDSQDSVFVVMDEDSVRTSPRTSPRKRTHSRGNSLVIGGAL
jgi:hypothetical protein